MLTLIMWVTQFGFSTVFPLCALLWLAAWLQNNYGIGQWIVVVFGLLGLLISASAARSCLRAMRREAERIGAKKKRISSFNDHE